MNRGGSSRYKAQTSGFEDAKWSAGWSAIRGGSADQIAARFATATIAPIAAKATRRRRRRFASEPPQIGGGKSFGPRMNANERENFEIDLFASFFALSRALNILLLSVNFRAVRAFGGYSSFFLCAPSYSSCPVVKGGQPQDKMNKRTKMNQEMEPRNARKTRKEHGADPSS